MPWIVKKEDKCKHGNRPKINENDTHLAGSIWECEACNRQFKLVKQTIEGGMQWDPYKKTIVVWKEGKYV